MASKYSLAFSNAAKKDLEKLFNYISNELSNPSAASRLIDEIGKALRNIQVFPMSSPNINNEFVNDQTLRKLFVRSYIVFYRVKNNVIQVVRVLHATSNYQSIL